MDGFVEVEDGAHGDRGGGAAPVADGLDEHRAPDSVEVAEPTPLALRGAPDQPGAEPAGDGDLGGVDAQSDRTPPRTCRGPTLAGRVVVKEGLAEESRARSPSARDRRTPRDSSQPSPRRWWARAVRAASRSRASGRSSSARISTRPSSPAWSRSRLACRASAAAFRLAWPPRFSTVHNASVTTRSSCAAEREWANPATWVSTWSAPSSHNAEVAAATRRARHTGAPAGHDLLPQPRQPVAALEDLRDVGRPASRGHPERGRVLQDRRLPHQRTPRASQSQAPVAEAHGDRDRVVRGDPVRGAELHRRHRANATSAASRAARADRAGARRSGEPEMNPSY